MRSVEVIQGKQAVRRITEKAFLDQWDRLVRDCPWSTSFQSAGFVTTWYAHYEQFAPLVLYNRIEHETLSGLLTLAVPKNLDPLMVAGGHQAEYQVWLSLPDHEGFIRDALEVLHQLYPARLPSFRYVPSRAPLSVLCDKESPVGARVNVVEHKRPLFRLEEESIRASLRKKSNKSRLSRLKKQGGYRLICFTDVSSFSRLFDEIILQYDMRQAALHQVFPFREDPGKKPFYLMLVEKYPDLVHASVLQVGHEVASAHIGLRDAHTLHLGLLSHAPWLARHSPGKFHLLLLGLQLAQEGLSLFDLTPGEDSWKARFTNDADTVFEIRAFPHPWAKTKNVWRGNVSSLAKRSLGRMGIDAVGLSARLKRACGGDGTKVRRNVYGSTRSKKPLLYVARIRTEELHAVPDTGVKKDSLSDLMKPSTHAYGQGLASFCSSSLRRLEEGQHVYTFASGRSLLHYGWLVRLDCSTRVSLPMGRAVGKIHALFYDVHMESTQDEFLRFQQILEQIHCHVATWGSSPCLYVALRPNQLRYRGVLEGAGFVRDEQFFQEKLVGDLNEKVV